MGFKARAGPALVSMRALILAAGEGSRLRPFTLTKPKPMVRAANKPIAQHVVEALTANGVKDITFVLGYQRAKVQSYFADGAKFGARISYAFQEALTGTAPALATVPRPSGPFLVLGGDNLVDANLIKAVLSAPGDGPALAVHKSANPSRYGVVSLDGSRVERIVEKPAQPRSEWVNTGVYRLTPAFHDRARQASLAGLAGIPEVLQSAIDAGERVEAIRSQDLWSDAVYPWDLLRMHGELLRGSMAPDVKAPGVHVDRGVLLGKEVTLGPGTFLGAGTCVGKNVEIHPNCVLENCVVYDDVRIGAGSVLRNTIVGEGTHVGARFTSISGPCHVRAADGWHALEDFGSIVGEDARIGGSVTLMPGTMLSNKVRVGHGRQVHGTIEEGIHVL